MQAIFLNEEHFTTIEVVLDWAGKLRACRKILRDVCRYHVLCIQDQTWNLFQQQVASGRLHTSRIPLCDAPIRPLALVKKQFILLYFYVLLNSRVDLQY